MSRDTIAFVEIDIMPSAKQNSKKVAERVEQFITTYNGNANGVLNIEKSHGADYAGVNFEMRSYYDFKMLDDIKTWAQQKGIVIDRISALEYVESDDGYYWERDDSDETDEVKIKL